MAVLRLETRVARLERARTMQDEAQFRAWAETLTDAHVDAICRGGPGEVDLYRLTAEEVQRVADGEDIETVRPDWRLLVNS